MCQKLLKLVHFDGIINKKTKQAAFRHNEQSWQMKQQNKYGQVYKYKQT